MVIWKLRTKLPDLGWVAIIGIESGEHRNLILFPHPSPDDSSLVFQATTERLEELVTLSMMELGKLNMRLEKKTVSVGKEYQREALETLPCPHCGDSVVWIDPDFPVHMLPSCDGWKMSQK